MKTLDRRGDAAAPGRRHLVVDARLPPASTPASSSSPPAGSRASTVALSSLSPRRRRIRAGTAAARQIPCLHRRRVELLPRRHCRRAPHAAVTRARAERRHRRGVKEREGERRRGVKDRGGERKEIRGEGKLKEINEGKF